MSNNTYSIDDLFWEWLDNFTKRYPSFVVEQIFHDATDLTNEDKVNINKIQELFLVVSEYAKKNYISSSKVGFKRYYTIKVSGSYYDIGCLKTGNYATYFCQINSIPTSFIDYDGIRMEVSREENESIQQMLILVKNTIFELQNMGLSLSDIYKYINDEQQKMGKY